MTSADPSLALSDALGLIATTPHLLVALDFDGTLAPFTDSPLGARALPEAQAAVLRLAAMNETSVALISGRALESLVEVGRVPDSVFLVGSHGVEYRIEGEAGVSLTEAERESRDRIQTILTEAAEGRDGVFVEEKPAGFAVHTRLASPEDASFVDAEVSRRIAAEAPEVTARPGKNVLEFSVRSATKGDGIDRLRSLTGATAVVFAGDDVTDEDGFRALGAGDFGLKVGPGETVAAFRVDAPADVAHVLEDLAELRDHLGRA